MTTRSSIATKVALVVSAVVVLALAATGGLALRSTDQALVDLQLEEATRRLETNLAITERILAERFPGPWHLEPVDGAEPVTLYNGNSRDPRWEVRETLASALFRTRRSRRPSPFTSAQSRAAGLRCTECFVKLPAG